MKQILTIFLLCPLTMIAMEEKQLDTNDIYAGVITTILHASPHKGSTCVYPEPLIQHLSTNYQKIIPIQISLNMLMQSKIGMKFMGK